MHPTIGYGYEYAVEIFLVLLWYVLLGVSNLFHVSEADLELKFKKKREGR